MFSDRVLSSGLDVDSLTKRFGSIAALDAVSFSIRPGETLGVIGPNGAGKTTLFECLAGLTTTDAGRLSHSGTSVPPRARSRHLFYVPDGSTPWPSETVGWSLEFAAGIWGRGRGGIVRDVIKALTLAPLLDRRMGALSKGQRKRVLIALGLVAPQPVLLIDEPFDGLDLRQSREIGAVLRGVVATGRTLVLSIHQIADAARFCDRFVLLSAGRVRAEGTLDEIAPDAAVTSAGERLEEAFLALS